VPLRPTLFDADARRRLLDRVERLEPDRRPRWGRMSAPEMVCHLARSLRQALGEIEAGPGRGPLALWPLNWLAIYVLPWPRGLKAPPELLEIETTTWERDVEALRALIEGFGARGPGGSWPPSPVLGRISGKDWGAMQHKHVDHHLCQFGV
jgi:hypothetical protein